MWDWLNGALGSADAGSSLEWDNFDNANFDAIGNEGISNNFGSSWGNPNTWSGYEDDNGIMSGMLGSRQPQRGDPQGMPSMPQMNVMPNLPQMNLQAMVNAPVQQQRRVKPYENNFLNYLKGGY